jgi:hypothetical protein
MKIGHARFRFTFACTLLALPAAVSDAVAQGSSLSLLEEVSGCWGVEISTWSGERVPRDLIIPPFIRLDTTHAFPADAESAGAQARRVLYPPQLEPEQYQSSWILTALTDSVVMTWGVARGGLSMSLGRELDALVGNIRFVSAELDADRAATARVRGRRLNDAWCERQTVRMAAAAAAAEAAAAVAAEAEAARMETLMAEAAAAEVQAPEVAAAEAPEPEAAAAEVQAIPPEPEAAAAEAPEPDTIPPEPEGAAAEAPAPDTIPPEPEPEAAATPARPRRAGPITVRLAATVVSRGTAALPANYDDIWDIRTAMVETIVAELDLDGNIVMYVPLDEIDPFNDSFHPQTDYVAELVLGYFEARDVLITETRIREGGSDRIIDEWNAPGSIDEPSVIEDRVVTWMTEHIRELP